jgi:hypothetical protein
MAEKVRIGHRGAGMVVDVGPGVSSVKNGDHLLQLQHGDLLVGNRTCSPAERIRNGYAADPPINLQPPTPSAAIVNGNPRS